MRRSRGRRWLSGLGGWRRCRRCGGGRRRNLSNRRAGYRRSLRCRRSFCHRGGRFRRLFRRRNRLRRRSYRRLCRRGRCSRCSSGLLYRRSRLGRGCSLSRRSGLSRRCRLGRGLHRLRCGSIILDHRNDRGAVRRLGRRACVLVLAEGSTGRNSRGGLLRRSFLRHRLFCRSGRLWRARLSLVVTHYRPHSRSTALPQPRPLPHHRPLQCCERW